MNVMPDPDHDSDADADVSETLSPTERAFRVDLNQKLRAPLNAIIGFAELLGMRPGESATKKRAKPGPPHRLRRALY